LPIVERDTPTRQISVPQLSRRTFSSLLISRKKIEQRLDDIPWKSDTFRLFIATTGELSTMSKSSWPVIVARSFQREILTVLPLQRNEMSQLGTDNFFVRNYIYKK
jgi:hypothetical protein